MYSFLARTFFYKKTEAEKWKYFGNKVKNKPQAVLLHFLINLKIERRTATPFRERATKFQIFFWYASKSNAISYISQLSWMLGM